MNGYITNQNDIFMYFEIINQTEPSSVLDIGMFLKRIGAVSRQCMGCEIDKNIVLEGIDFMGDISAPVYNTIYNTIYGGAEDIETIIGSGASQGKYTFVDKNYDLSFAIRPEIFLREYQEEVLWQWLGTHTKYAVTEQSAGKRVEFIQDYKNCKSCKELNVGEDTYLLIEFER
ncbi:MAG: hypothetical protein IIX45_09585 [Lachnospiraceae bacterium]|nr:hypothetical protein [Lachnospiraceae bacterium]